MVPDFQSIMLPLLKLLGDNQVHKRSDLIPQLADHFNLSGEDRNEVLPSGTQLKFENRVYWAITYLKHAGLLVYPSRGSCQVTGDGLGVLSNPPEFINLRFLRTFPLYRQWQESMKSNKTDSNAPVNNFEVSASVTPDELIEESYANLTELLSTEILEKIKSCTPKFFEHLVIDLLLKMGYGGSKVEAGEVLGKSNDGGIDGLIKEDKLGLDTIYVQAKKWDSMVPIAQVRDFAGALLAKKAKKGIFITTSSFPSSAREFVASIEPRIVLIDGEQLAEL
ncbi:partial Mrr restriction system protein, partial [uncultured bacterium]